MRNVHHAHPSFSADLLNLDCAAECARIADILTQALRRFKKKGLIVALSGGIDSTVVAALAVRALGKDRVLGLLMPERDSSPTTLPLSREIAEHLRIPWILEELTPLLEAAGCYRRRDEAIKTVVPDFRPGCRSKIILPSAVEHDGFRLFSVVVEFPDGRIVTRQLDLTAYLGILAASNFKQRCRKMLEYYHADRLNYAVAGTPNRLEYDQGFFVKLGDGAADIKPIAHLYKTQVYQLGRFLVLPDQICSRPPTTDTYSMPQSQEEFYFSLPYDKMDLVLYGKDAGFAAEQIAPSVGLSPEQVDRVFRDIENKRRVAAYLHASPIIIDELPTALTAPRSNLCAE